MADNETTGTAKAVATDKVTYSGDADQNVQLVRFVQVTGSEGSKTVVDLPGNATDGLLINLGANNDVTVTGTVSVSGTVTVDSELPAAAAISAENTAAPTAPSVYSFGLVFDGTNWDRAAGNSTDGQLVNLGTNNDVTVTSGTVTADPTASSTMNATSSDGGTALTSTAQAIKGSAGVLTGYYIYNPNATAQFVQFYNTASGSVTVGTTNPLFMLTIPATSAANLAGLCTTFSTAMSWAATSTAGGNGAPTTALDAVAWYR